METRSKLELGLAAILLAAIVWMVIAPIPVMAGVPERSTLPVNGNRLAGVFQAAVVFVDDDFTPDTLGWGVTHFATIQAGIDAVDPGGTVQVAAGTYAGQVVISKNLTLAGDNKASNILAMESMPACFTTSSSENHPVVCVKDGADATIDGFTINGLGLGNSNYRFTGVAFHNAGGSVINNDVIDIRDTPFSGVQQGVAIYAYNEDGVARSIQVSNNTITGFQKNAMALNANETTPLTVEVKNNTITGAGATTVIAQNGIQVLASLGSGVIADNTINGIGYNNTADPIKSAGTSILNFNAALEVSGNNISGAQMGISFIDGSGLIYDNDIKVTKIGVSSYGIVASYLPNALPAPFVEADGQSTNRLMEVPAAKSVEISNNRINYWNPSYQMDVYGIEADAGYDAADLAINIHHNLIKGFGTGINFYQCDSSLEECTGSQFVSLTVEHNNLDGNELAIAFNQYVTAEAQVHYNRLFNSYTPYNSGILNLSSAPVHAEYNWWGCNYGPAQAADGCSLVEGIPGMVIFDPWIALWIDPISPVPAGQTIPVAANLLHTIEEIDIPAGEFVPDGVEIYFAANKGSVNPEMAVTKDGLAVTTYLAPATAGSASICAWLDAINSCQNFDIYEPLVLNDLNLLVSTDAATWTDVPGSFVDGFRHALDTSAEYYYLDAADLVVNRALKDGYYPFYVATYPADYFTYWATRDVVAGATCWQGIMWEIINGTKPLFYLKVTGTDYDLIDGLQYQLDQTDHPLRIEGGYLPGEYIFTGEVEDTLGYKGTVTVGVTFNDIPVADDKSVQTNEDTPVGILLTATDLYPGELSWEVSTPAHGSLTGTAPNLIYTPAIDYSGLDSITFTVSDGELTSPPATVSIAVTEMYVAPVLSSTDLEGPYTTDIQQEFHVTLENPAGGDAFTNVLVHFSIANAGLTDIASLEYFDPADSQWKLLPLSADGAGNLVGDYGPVSGFPIVPGYNATSTFRVTFNTARTYPVTITVVDLTTEPDTVLATLEKTATVNLNMPFKIYMPIIHR